MNFAVEKNYKYAEMVAGLVRGQWAKLKSGEGARSTKAATVFWNSLVD